MTKQERMIDKIRREIETEIQRIREKYGIEVEIKEFMVTELGINEIKEVYFVTNRVDGNILTETRGQLFVGKRGGVHGEMRAWESKTRITSSNQLYKVAAFML